MAIKAPVVGSRNGGAVADDVVGKVNGLYVEPKERFDRSWPLIPDENKLGWWGFGEWEPKIKLGENLLVEWEFGEPEKIRLV